MTTPAVDRPGTTDAWRQGCRCRPGYRSFNGTELWWVSERCPLHWRPEPSVPDAPDPT